MRGDGSDTLYLFTYSFPFGRAETFLETEIPYLASGWRRVVVLPARLEGERRPLPPNVEVEEGLGRVLQRGPGAAALAAAALDPIFRAELRRRPSAIARPQEARRLMGQVLVARSTERWIADYLRRDGADRPLCYSYWLNFAAFGLARMKPAWPGMTFVSRAHGKDLYAERHDPPYLPLQRNAVAMADAIFPVSEHGRTYLKEHYPDRAASVEVARLGVTDPGTLCEASTDECWRILSCSALLTVKRIDHLVRGLDELARRYPRRRIGWTHLGNGPLRSLVEVEARTLPSNVDWRIAGHIPNDEVLGYYHQNPVDVFVNVSESEGVPVSIMEAQSLGVPTVATAVGGVPEIVTPTTGVLISPDATPNEIADGVQRICNDPARARGLRTGARESWQARYDAERNYPQFVSTLRQMLQC